MCAELFQLHFFTYQDQTVDFEKNVKVAQVIWTLTVNSVDYISHEGQKLDRKKRSFKVFFSALKHYFFSFLQLNI